MPYRPRRGDALNPTPDSKTAVKMTSAVYRFKEKSIRPSYRLFFTFTQNGPTEIFLKKKIQTNPPRVRQTLGSSFLKLISSVHNTSSLASDSPYLKASVGPLLRRPALPRHSWPQPKIPSMVQTRQQMPFKRM
jgi:hypothetical protein